LDCKYIPFYRNRKTTELFILRNIHFYCICVYFCIKFDDKMKKNRISASLIDWYDRQKRDLPWRNINDPYRIWISEIILQQTRVAQGLDYYRRFISRFQDVISLAEADEDEVLKYWQGLGYYSRARNLHQAAKTIAEKYNGIFPSLYRDVRALKGVGDYTAAAICSFAYGQPFATVDGNVYRVLSRLFDVDLPIDSTEGKRFFAELAQQILSVEDPATHNQAMMELGATQCLPRNPDCNSCPLQDVCLAYHRKRVELLPVKQGKTVVKNRFFNYFLVRFGDYIYLNKRTGNDIWKNLFEFPLIETTEKMALNELALLSEFRLLFDGVGELSFQLKKENVVHLLSHRRISADFYEVEVDCENDTLKGYQKVHQSDFSNFAISRLTHILIEDQTDDKYKLLT